jgi:transcriptional regulator with XRE-family HTH domain
MTIGQRINLIRYQKDMTVDELAEKSNISKHTINAWLYAGYNPHIEALIQIADVFDMSLDDLVGRKRKENDKQLH